MFDQKKTIENDLSVNAFLDMDLCFPSLIFYERKLKEVSAICFDLLEGFCCHGK